MEMDTLKRYSAAEIVLLGIFAIGLGLSLILVKIRSVVELNAPVDLPYSGLAAPLPKGAEWETAGGWLYESDNAFVLLGRMRSRGRMVMNVRWRYAICDEPIESESLLQQRADIAKGHLEPLGILNTPLQMYYGRIYAPTESGEEFLLGVARLGYGRCLELHVAYRSDSTFAENTFRALARGVVYEPSALLEAGAESVTQFYADQTDRISATEGQSEQGYLIKDITGRPLGYAARRLFAYNGTSEGHLRLTTRQFEPSGLYTESDLWLTVSDKTFTWKTQTWIPRLEQPRTADIRMDSAGRLRVQKNTEQQQFLQRTPIMLPEPLITEFAAGLSKASVQEMVIDVLMGNGIVVPTRLSLISDEKAVVRSVNAATIVRAEYLHMQGTFDDFLFDSDGHLLGCYVQQPRKPGQLWDAASQEQLRQIFGERFEPRRREAVQLIQ